MRFSILASALAVAISSVSFAAHAADPQSQELADLKQQLAALQAKVMELEQRTDAQSDVNVTTAQSLEETQAAQKKVDKLAKIVNDTALSGKMFFDVTNIKQEDNGTDTNASGTGIDVKRFYLGVNHKFDETWSANLTTDFQYNSTLDSAANLYVKKAYIQGKFSDAFVARAGSADLPWIPFAESAYGFRYVENTLTDRLKFGTSADWGLHAAGDLGASKMVNYAVSVVNGGGYKNPSRTKSMDVEGRVGFVPFEGMVVAVGAYSGKLGKEKENVNAEHTANRVDALVAYSGESFRLGAEYFQAKNWTTVLNPLSDKADGWSVWGNVGLGSGGITAFARYDKANLSKEINPNLEDTYYNVGVEFPIRKGVKLAAVYKNDRQKDDAAIDLKTREVGVWGEVSF
jgi:hypothetical protein